MAFDLATQRREQHMNKAHPTPIELDTHNPIDVTPVDAAQS